MARKAANCNGMVQTAKPFEHGGWATLPFSMGISNIGLMPVLMSYDCWVAGEGELRSITSYNPGKYAAPPIW